MPTHKKSVSRRTSYPVRLDENLRLRLVARKDKLGIPVQFQVNQAVRAYLDDFEEVTAKAARRG